MSTTATGNAPSPKETSKRHKAHPQRRVARRREAPVKNTESETPCRPNLHAGAKSKANRRLFGSPESHGHRRRSEAEETRKQFKQMRQKTREFGPEISLCFGLVNLNNAFACNSRKGLSLAEMNLCRTVRKRLVLALEDLEAAVYELGIPLNAWAPYRFPVDRDETKQKPKPGPRNNTPIAPRNP